MATATTQQPWEQLQCPRCSGLLQARRYADLEVDECDNCGGLLMSPLMMDKIVVSHEKSTGLRLALPRRSYQHETVVRYIQCPTCKRSMNRRAFGRISGVVVDVCRQHGVWFDAGELGEVLTFIERGGLEVARERERQEATEQARSVRAENLRLAATDSLDATPGALGRSGVRVWAEFGTVVVQALVELWRE
jgi:Zn-finger nucleic acid-binding protein